MLTAPPMPRRPVDRRARAALDLDVLDARLQVHEIEPVDGVVFRVVHRLPVDRDGEAPFVEAAQAKRRVAKPVARLRVRRHRRLRGERDREVLGGGLFGDGGGAHPRDRHRRRPPGPPDSVGRDGKIGFDDPDPVLAKHDVEHLVARDIDRTRTRLIADVGDTNLIPPLRREDEAVAPVLVGGGSKRRHRNDDVGTGQRPHSQRRR